MNLVDEAKLALSHAYAPYSNFRVGAAVEYDGVIYHGCNIENASYGLTNCAERSALYAAVSDGVAVKSIKKLVLYTETEQVTAPCGACRQVLLELLHPQAEVVSVGNKGVEKRWTLAQLLPDSFSEVPTESPTK